MAVIHPRDSYAWAEALWLLGSRIESKRQPLEQMMIDKLGPDNLKLLNLFLDSQIERLTVKLGDMKRIRSIAGEVLEDMLNSVETLESTNDTNTGKESNTPECD